MEKQDSEHRSTAQNTGSFVNRELGFVVNKESSGPTPEEKMRWADDGGPDYD